MCFVRPCTKFIILSKWMCLPNLKKLPLVSAISNIWIEHVICLSVCVCVCVRVCVCDLWTSMTQRLLLILVLHSHRLRLQLDYISTTNTNTHDAPGASGLSAPHLQCLATMKCFLTTTWQNSKSGKLITGIHTMQAHSKCLSPPA